MKHYLLLAMASLALTQSAAAMDASLVVWNQSTAEKPGSDALVSYAQSLNISQIGDNYQIPFAAVTDGAEYRLTLPGVAVKSGDTFCLHISDGDKDYWPHYDYAAYPECQDWFTDQGDGHDMRFGQDYTVTDVTLKVSGSSYKLIFGEERHDPKPVGTPSGHYLRGTQLAGQWDNTNTDYPFYWVDDSHTSIYIDFEPALIVSAEDDRNFAVGPQGSWAENMTIVAGSNTNFKAGDNVCFYGGGRNFTLPAGLEVARIEITLPANNEYATGNSVPSSGAGNMKIITAAAASRKSNFALDVWSSATLGEGGPWDSAGGLYKPFRTDDEYFNLDDKYKQTITFDGGDTKNFLTFYGPLTDDEIKAYNDKGVAARKYTTDDYETWKDQLGFQRENSSELYVIDFTEHESQGIFITTPTRTDMLDHRNGTADLSNFFCFGVRFGFIDMDFELTGDDSQSEADRINNHFRYVKWGHLFRLNEVARPLNAFPTYDAQGNVDGFTDDFGPARWNGFDGADWKSNGTSGLGINNNKMGDSRLLAEHDHWLKQIFLEVAYDEHGNKHFYLYFIGERNIMAGMQTEGRYYYQEADPEIENHQNFVHGSPNIFHGTRISLNEMGYQRFFNLNVADADVCREMIGISPEEYQQYRGINNYLYNLDLTDDYTVESKYEVRDSEDNIVKTFKGRTVAREFSYTARDGAYYNGDEKLPTEPGGVAMPGAGLDHKIFIAPEAFELLYDPENAHKPVKVTINNVYTFENGAFPSNIKKEYEFQCGHPEHNTEIPVTANAKWANESFTEFTSQLSWQEFASVDGWKGTLPVAGYTISAYGTPDDGETPDAAMFSPVDTSTDWVNSADMSLESHTYSNTARELGQTYYVHYNVETQYNFAYVKDLCLAENLNETNGLAYSRTDGADETGYISLPVDGKDLNGNDIRYNLQYTIRPESISGRGVAVFSTLTGIDEIAADALAPVYYNLQGVRVDNPSTGIYIKVTGNTSEKVIF